MKAALILVVVVFVCQLAGAQDVPAPPAQTRPWTRPHTSLPDLVVSASAILFDEGMVDPRGCEYREIEIAKNAHYTIKTHGWVLPGTGEKHYAVGWNGLVYPVASVGAPVDVRAEFAALPSAPASRQFPHRLYQMEESQSLGIQWSHPIQVALLLRFGEVTLAETVWREGAAGSPDAARDAFASMAHVWLARWFTRALEAYARDDYPAAADLCRQIAPVEEKAREEAIRRGTPDPWPDTAEREILWQVPILETEAERRIGEWPYTPVLESNKPAAGPERIAALIRDLERVRVHVMTSPGQTNVSDDPVVRALVRAGPDAVEPLLKCLVDDDRLTRTRYGYRSYEGPVIPVYECAYVALFQLLQTHIPLEEKRLSGFRQSRDIRHFDREDRRALAAQLAAVWAQQKGRPAVERAYDTLRDDLAGPKAWLQAVDNIVQPTDGTFTDYLLVRPSGVGYGVQLDPTAFTPGGESLRSRADPSVSDLLIKRFEQLGRDDSSGDWDLGSGRPANVGETLGKLLLSLAGWDGKAHLDDLRRLQGELVERLRRQVDEAVEGNGQSYERYEAGQVLFSLFERRLALGDPRALEEDVDFLQSLSAKRFGPAWGTTPGNFRLLWRHPDDPAVARAAETMFGADSAWVPFTKTNTHNLAALIRTPLIGLPAFRRELERGLGDRSAAGEVTLGDNGLLDDGTSRLYTPDPLAPPKGTKVAYRLCDLYAHELSFLDGFPECELYWPQADRDRAATASRVFLQRYADNFRYREPEDKGRDHSFGSTFEPRIHFPVLDHPATAEDVEAGRAVFSLPAPSRVCRLTGLPLEAQRPGHPVDPHDAGDGNGKRVVSYNTHGRVWQVEETLVDGKWERFYGFVGRYQLTKVPAAEIDFGTFQDTARVTPEIGGNIESAVRRANGELSFGMYVGNFYAPDAPVPIRVSVHNRNALDQPLPASLVLPAGTGKALPPGMRLSLSYSAKTPPRIKDYTDPPFDYGAWQEITLRDEVRTAVGAASGPVLSPDQRLTLLETDLRDYYDLSRAGSYRLRAVFQVTGQPESASADFTFSVVP